MNIKIKKSKKERTIKRKKSNKMPQLFIISYTISFSHKYHCQSKKAKFLTLQNNYLLGSTNILIAESTPDVSLSYDF